MTKYVSVLVVLVVGLAALAAAGPALVKVGSALAWLVLVVGLVAIALRLVWFYTRRW